MSGKRARAFRKVGGLRPGRSVFDLTHEHKTTCDMGQLIPIFWDELSPGDRYTLHNEVVIRLQPTVAPVLHEINVYTHTFFVPLRLLYAEWEEFIRRGEDGDTDIPLPVRSDYASLATEFTLLDYFGCPLGIDPVGAYPLLWPWRTYNLIWNEYYRDQELQDEVDLDQNEVLHRCWEKDYFTIARPAQQRGTPMAIPLSGLGNVKFTGNAGTGNPGSSFQLAYLPSDNSLYTPNGSAPAFRNNWLSQNELDFSSAGTFDVKDLRVLVQLQKWQERNMRAGTRYNEMMRAQHGVAPRDERLQRPEYIGGTKSPVIISEVLQTSSSDATSPQGNLAGHGIVADRTKIGSYFAEEYGIIMTLLSVMPRTVYQQGIRRQLLRRTVFDYYWRTFANLSEQAVMMAEIYATNDAATNMEVFGYQGQYDEMRYIPSYVTGGMRNLFDYWHLSRKFANKPLLNASFVECRPDKRIFASQNEHGLLVNYASILQGVRQMPVMADPGSLDHF